MRHGTAEAGMGKQGSVDSPAGALLARSTLERVFVPVRLHDSPQCGAADRRRLVPLRHPPDTMWGVGRARFV